MKSSTVKVWLKNIHMIFDLYVVPTQEETQMKQNNHYLCKKENDKPSNALNVTQT